MVVTALIASLILFLLLKKWRSNSRNSSLQKQLPPGPKPFPIIGNLHQLSSPPFRCFRDLSSRYGPIMCLKLGSAPMVVVSSPELAKHMLKDQELSFAGRPQSVAIEIMWYNYVDMAFCPYGDYWRQMRKICINHLLSPRMVRTFGSIRRDEAVQLVEYLRFSSGANRPVNLTQKIFSLSSSITCRAAFGKVCRDRDTLIEMVMETLKLAGGFEIADCFPSSRIVYALSWTRMRAKMMRRKLDVILDGIIDEHSRNLAAMDGRGDEYSGRMGNSEFGSEDLVDVLLRIKEEEKLQFPIANDNIKAVLYDMFVGGTDTTATTIDWAMVELMRNPLVMKKAQDEVRLVLKRNDNTSTSFGEDDVNVQKLNYLKLVIKETLRLHPPGPMVPRATREECEINGYTIPADVKVMINVWAMHRDPRYWKDPERFEPERFENQTMDFIGGDFQFLPFGSGRRICPGMMFAVTTVELVLAYLLYNFNWKLPEGVGEEDLDMIENHGLTAARKHNLFVVATTYQ